MSEVTKAVITDESAQKILQEMQVANSINREARDLMSEQAEATRKLYEKMGNASYEAAAVYYVPVTYDGTAYSLDGITFDDVLNAYEDGKYLILRLINGDVTCYAPLRSYEYRQMPNVIGYSIQFFAPANPSGELGGFNLMRRVVVATGAVTDSIVFEKQGIYPSAVMCDVTIGGTPYTTLDAALNAIVAAIG